MTIDLTTPQPTMVKISRAPTGAGDLSSFESVVGYLVDEEGNDRESPEIGKPIYLSGDQKKDEPWLFRTDAVWKIEVYELGWKILTEQGTSYSIENQRQYQ